MTQQDADDLFIYSERYAIGRHTYASATVAEVITKFVAEISVKNRLVLIRDIETAFTDHAVDELSTTQWEECLKALKAAQQPTGEEASFKEIIGEPSALKRRFPKDERTA